MTITGVRAKRDLQGGLPPRGKPRGRQVKAVGVPAAAACPNGQPSPAPPARRRARGGAAIAVVEDPPSPEAPTLKLLALSHLVPSPTNPRGACHDAELAELAASIRQVGLLQPIVARPRLHQWEIVAGERRYRAAALAGLDKVPVLVRALDDWQALRVQWTENAQREDISPIDEAHHFRRMLAAREGLTQQALADELGISQGHLANRLRLLELPAAIQQMVISREIPATHARELVPYARFEGAFERVAAEIKGGRILGTANELCAAIQSAVCKEGVVLSGDVWQADLQQYVAWRVVPTPQQRAAWGVVEIQIGANKGELVALPVDAARQAAAAARETASAQARARAARRRKQLPAAVDSSPPDPQAAEALFAKRLAAWRADWLRVLSAARMRDPDFARYAEMFFLAAVLDRDIWERRDPDALEAAMNRLGTRQAGYSRSPLELVRYAAVEHELDELRRELAIGLLVDADQQPLKCVPDREVTRLAELLEIDPIEQWKSDQAGALTEAYWQLHTREQLLDLAVESGLGGLLSQREPKRELVALLLAKAPRRLPDELRQRPEKQPANRRAAEARSKRDKPRGGQR